MYEALISTGTTRYLQKFARYQDLWELPWEKQEVQDLQLNENDVYQELMPLTHILRPIKDFYMFDNAR